MAHTQAKYLELINAWRMHPNSPKAVQDMTGCNYTQVTNALKWGWPEADFDAPPIKDILEDERKALGTARTVGGSHSVQRELADDEAKRRANLKILQEEEKMSINLRRVAVEVSSSFADLLPAITFMAKSLRRALEDLEVSDTPPDPKTTMSLLRSAMKCIQDGVTMCKGVMELERLRVGKPTGRADTSDELSYDDAVAELSKLSRTVERVQPTQH